MKNYYPAYKFGFGLAALASQYFNRTRTVTETRRKRKRQPRMSGTTEWTRSKRTTRLQKKSIRKKLYGTTQTIIDRFQGLTNFDTNSGFYALCYRKCASETEFPQVMLPIHLWDVTQWGQQQGMPCGCSLGWAQRSNDDSNILRLQHYGQNPGNDQVGTDNFWVTKGQNIYGTVPPHACLDWLDIRLNLYGARVRDTLFRVQLVRFKDEFADLFQAAPDNGSAKELLTELERPLIYNNLQVGQWHEVQSRMQVIRSYTYKVPAKKADDLNTSCGNIKEVKLFVRMNKACNYDYDRGLNNFKHENINQGAEYETDQNGTNHRCRPQSRVYLMISAFCPHLRTPGDATNFGYWQFSNHEAGYAAPPPEPGQGFGVDIDHEPTYDMLLRRKFTTMSYVV